MGQLAGHHTWWILYTHHPQRVCIEGGVELRVYSGGCGGVNGAGTTCWESYLVDPLHPSSPKSYLGVGVCRVEVDG